ncbi:Pao retrotransposon peptidase family protein [Aphelenchoides avenae]|nr:Pao retrotransposon peptidase family protein [Aphelenchus avenae]
MIKLHPESVGTPQAREMLPNCVDNVLVTADTVSKALAKYHEAKEISSQIGMPLREFASNSAEFNVAIDPADKADLTKLNELGIRWDILSDCWNIPLMPKQAPHADNAGGQACLAASTTVREPPANNAGTLGPVAATQKKRKGRLVQAATLLLKLVIREAWKRDKAGISGDLAELCNKAVKNIAPTVIRVTRRISKGKIKSVEVHVFTDGSSYAYGFTSYLRIRNADGTYSTNLIYARARVKPIKDAEKFTIPRMELLGVLLGTRNAAFLHKELRTHIANTEAIKEVWTENRLKEIRRLRDSLPIQFRHVPTEDNPADIVSRGIPAAALQNCEKWWHGAPFLGFDTSRWPGQPTTLRTKPSPSDQPTEIHGTTAFTTLFIGQSTQPNSQWINQRSQRKKKNPLDIITEHRLPTYHLPRRSCGGQYRRQCG